MGSARERISTGCGNACPSASIPIGCQPGLPSIKSGLNENNLCLEDAVMGLLLVRFWCVPLAHRVIRDNSQFRDKNSQLSQQNSQLSDHGNLLAKD